MPDSCIHSIDTLRRLAAASLLLLLLAGCDRQTAKPQAEAAGGRDRGKGRAGAAEQDFASAVRQDTIRGLEDLLRLPHQVLRAVVDLAPRPGHATL